MTTATVTSVAARMKDFYPRPGERIKQYVVDMRREHQWEVSTCPGFSMPVHDDNTGVECRNAGARVPWTFLAHDCCEHCCEAHEQLGGLSIVKAWLAEKAKRPPIESDEAKLSDEVAPDVSLESHPLLAMLPRGR